MGNPKKLPAKKKDQLLDLINQLSANELRYFHLYSQLTPNEKNFQKLFKLIQGKKTFNTSELKQLTKGKMNLAYEKQYLQKMLLRSLRNYHSESSPEIIINEYLTDIEILYRHGMSEMAWALIQKAKSLAIENEMTLHYLIICNWEHRYIGVTIHNNQLETNLQANFADERKRLYEHENILDYKFLKFGVLRNMRHKGVLQGPDEQDYIRQLVDHPLMASEKMAKSFKAKMLYYEIQIHYYMLQNQWKPARQTAAQAVELIETTPNAIRNYLQNYYVMLCNYSNACIVEADYSGVEIAVKKMVDLLNNQALKIPPKYRADIFAYSVERKMVALSIKKDFRKGIEYGLSVVEDIKKYKGTVHNSFKTVFDYFMALFYFHEQKYTAAHSHLRQILNDDYSSTRRDYQLAAMLMNILVHYELKNEEILLSLLLAMNRFCKSSGIKSAFLTLFNQMIKDLIKAKGNKPELRKIFSLYQKETERLNQNSQDSIIMGTLDISDWFKHKIHFT